MRWYGCGNCGIDFHPQSMYPEIYSGAECPTTQAELRVARGINIRFVLKNFNKRAKTRKATLTLSEFGVMSFEIDKKRDQLTLARSPIVGVCPRKDCRTEVMFTQHGYMCGKCDFSFETSIGFHLITFKEVKKLLVGKSIYVNIDMMNTELKTFRYEKSGLCRREPRISNVKISVDVDSIAEFRGGTYEVF